MMDGSLDSFFNFYCEKYRNFTWFPDVEILRKGIVFRAIHPKLCGDCAFPQNFHTRKSGEMTVFFVVFYTRMPILYLQFSSTLSLAKMVP